MGLVLVNTGVQIPVSPWLTCLSHLFDHQRHCCSYGFSRRRDSACFHGQRQSSWCGTILLQEGTGAFPI